jgi:phage protein U
MAVPAPKLAWIPACAGMTTEERVSLPTNVMPAQAGIHASLRLLETRSELQTDRALSDGGYDRR